MKRKYKEIDEKRLKKTKIHHRLPSELFSYIFDYINLEEIHLDRETGACIITLMSIKEFRDQIETRTKNIYFLDTKEMKKYHKKDITLFKNVNFKNLDQISCHKISDVKLTLKFFIDCTFPSLNRFNVAHPKFPNTSSKLFNKKYLCFVKSIINHYQCEIKKIGHSIQGYGIDSSFESILDNFNWNIRLCIFDINRMKYNKYY